MTIVKINWKPSPRDLRQWGLIMLPATIVVGAIMYWLLGHPGFAKFLWVFGAVCFLTGITGTLLAKPFYYAWMGFVFTVATVIGVTTLTLAYYGVVTPIAIIAKLLGRDRLHLAEPPKDASLWRPVEKIQTGNRFERQF